MVCNQVLNLINIKMKIAQIRWPTGLMKLLLILYKAKPAEVKTITIYGG